MIPDKLVDIGVKIHPEGEEGVRNMSESLDELRNSLAETDAVADETEDEIEELNREMMEGAAGTSTYASGLEAVKAQLASTSAMSETFGDNLDEVTKEADKAQTMLNKVDEAIDGSFEDASAGDIDFAQYRALKDMMEEGHLDKDEMVNRFSDFDKSELGMDDLLKEYTAPQVFDDQVRSLEQMDEIINELTDGDMKTFADQTEDLTTNWQEFMTLLEDTREELGESVKPMDQKNRENVFDDFRDVPDQKLAAAVREAVMPVRYENKEWFMEEGQDEIEGHLPFSTLPNFASEKDIKDSDIPDDAAGNAFRFLKSLRDDDRLSGEPADRLRNFVLGDEAQADLNKWPEELLGERPDDPTNYGLTDLQKVGDKRSKKLVQSGLETIHDVAESTPEEIADALDAFGEQVSDDIHESAQGLSEELPRGTEITRRAKLAEWAGVPRPVAMKALSEDGDIPSLEDIGPDTSDVSFDMHDQHSMGGTMDNTDLRPSRSTVVDVLSEMLGSSGTEGSILHNIMDEMGAGLARPGQEGDPRKPFAAETARAKLFERFINADERQTEMQIMELFDKLERGEINLPSLMELDGAGGEQFRETFQKDLRERLKETGVPEDILPDLAGRITKQFQGAMDEEVFISQILNDTSKLNKILDKSVSKFEEIELEGEDSKAIMEEMISAQDQLLDKLAQSAARSEELYGTRVSPSAMMALDEGETPFGGRAFGDDLFRKGREGDNFGWAYHQQDKVSTQQQDVSRFGTAGDLFKGIFPMMFDKADEIIEKDGRVAKSLNLVETNALDADKAFQNLIGTLDELVPRLGANSISLGPLNASLAKMGSFLWGLMALVGPLAAAVIGLAGALAAAGAALGSFLAVGGLGYLEHLQQTMAGVNSRAEAMQKLMGALKEDVMQAIEPLRNVGIGGKGPMQMFVDTLKGALDILHQFATIMASIIETDEFQSFITNISEALFSADGGPTMLEAMRKGIQRLLPYIEGFLVFVINSAPEFIAYVTRIADIVMKHWAPMMSKLIPLLSAAIEFGAHFINMVGAVFRFISWIVTLGGHLEYLAPLFGALIQFLAVTTALEWSASFATITLAKAYGLLADTMVVSALSALWSWISASIIAIAQNYGLSASVTSLRTALWWLATDTLPAVLTNIWAYIGSTQVATAATWAWNAAITAIPYVAVAVAIGAILYGLYKFVNWTSVAKTITNAWSDAIHTLTNSLSALSIGLGMVLLLVTAVGAAFTSISLPILATVGVIGMLIAGLGIVIKLLTQLTGKGLMKSITMAWKGLVGYLEGAYNFLVGIWNIFKKMMGKNNQHANPMSSPYQKEKRTGGQNAATVINQWKINATGKNSEDTAKATRREIEKANRRKDNYAGKGGNWWQF